MSKPVKWSRLKTGVTANPAAGSAPATLTVPAGKKWLFMGGVASLVADANASNRYVRITVAHDGTNPSYTTQGPVQVATQTVSWSFAPGTFQSTSTTSYNILSLPSKGIEIPVGGTVAIVTGGLLAGDDWSAFAYWYKEAPA